MGTSLLINDLLQTAHTHWGSPELINLHRWTMLCTLHRKPLVVACSQYISESVRGYLCLQVQGTVKVACLSPVFLVPLFLRLKPLLIRDKLLLH